MSDFILFEQRGALGLITLNRPQALNAMDADMAITMHDRLLAWADDDSIRTVAIQGTGKAFCAGGDIRAVWQMREDAMRFFDPEYRLCRLIHSYSKPYVALMDGVTMGGGVGISIYASHCIATPNTLWAMPECAIGFYPDIGATWCLPRLPGETGTWLALTGARLRANDLLPLGIATGFAAEPGDVLRELADGLLPSTSVIPDGPRSGTSRDLAGADPGSTLRFGRDDDEVRDAIDRCFAFDTVEEIVAALENEPGDWALQTLAALRRNSPTSLKVTLRQMRVGRTLSFEQAMTMELGMTRRFLQRPDFYEGIRAALIDRDGGPKWDPLTLDKVDTALVDFFFTDSK